MTTPNSGTGTVIPWMRTTGTIMVDAALPLLRSARLRGGREGDRRSRASECSGSRGLGVARPPLQARST